MPTLNADTINDSAGSGAPDFPSGFTVNGDPSALATYKTETKALDSGFATGNVRFERIGRTVTITADIAATHASLTTVSTTGTFVPADYRPSGATVRNVYSFEGTRLCFVSVSSAGLLTTEYRDYTGAGDADVDTHAPVNISYTIY